jgi:hypothetical protein
MDFFDDFDWEDMALAGSMAEEMSEEERRMRWLEEEGFVDANGDDFLEEPRRRPRRPKARGRRRPVRKPFEQWLDDYLHGRKQLHDPLYGPSRTPGPSTVGRPASAKAVILGVPVFNAQLVSEKYLKFICIALSVFPEHALNGIFLDDDGTPVVDGEAVFGIFDAGNRTIRINLRRHLENAVRIVEHGIAGFSIRHIIWDSMLRVFLHEIKHALDTQGGEPSAGIDRSQQDRTADLWAAEVITVLAQRCDLEPSSLAEDPYFGPRVTRYVEQAVSRGNWLWAKEQKEMLDKGILYRKRSAGFEFRSEKEFFALSAAGLKGDARGCRLNELISHEQQLEGEAWDRDEMCARALREAIDAGRRLRIDYLQSEDCSRTYTILPLAFAAKGPFLWVESCCEPDSRPVAFRIDRISNIYFV